MAYNKKYYDEHRETILKQQKKYYRKNKTKIIKRVMERRAEVRDAKQFLLPAF
jgi:hypothetical protein